MDKPRPGRAQPEGARVNPKRRIDRQQGDLVRRLLGICAVAVTVFAAMALFARAQSGGTSGTIVVTDQAYPSWFSYVHSSSLPPGPLTVVVYGLPRTVAAGTSRSLPLFSLADMANRIVREYPGESTTGGDPYNSLVFWGNSAGSGRAGFSGDGGDATDAELSLSQDSLVKRSGIAVAEDGTIFIADTKNRTIRAVAGPSSSEPGIIRSVAGKWAPAQNVQLVEPMGIAVDRAGNLYVADHAAGTVSVLSQATGRLAILAHVASPASLAVRRDGSKVFVASPETGGVFAIKTLDRSIQAVPGFVPAAAEAANAGPCASLESGATGAASTAASATKSETAATGICPAGVAADGAGNLFVADANSGKILRVDAATGRTTSAAVGMITPGDIAFDSQGDLFVSEQGRNRILALVQLGAPVSGLTLTAPAPPAGCPQGASFTYCNEPSGGTSPSFAFTLANISGSSISGITITPAFVPVGTQPPPAPTSFTTTSTSCTATLAAGASCVIKVAFTPLAPGAIAGQLMVSDATPSDTQTVNLAGTGDDFSLAIVSGQSPEVTASQGNTATFMAQLNADSVFGQNGEKVTLACPTNLPQFTTCEFQPCPIVPTLGGATPFSILVHTSTANSETPPISNPCNSPAAAARARRAGMPSGILYVTSTRPPGGAPRFPALLPLFAVVMLLGFGCAAVSALRAGAGAASRRAFAAMALLAVASGLVAACKHGSNPNSTATPLGVTNMTVTANAVDSSGNSLHASRGLQITLDVIKQQKTGP